MPELPEVETVRRGLHNLIIGREINDVFHDTSKSFPNAPDDVSSFLIGSSVTDVRRRAKVLLIDLSTDYTLVIHLKMTGQLVFVGRKEELGDRSWELDGTIAKQTPNSQLQTPGEPHVRFGAGHPNDSLIGQLPDKSTRVTITFNDGSHLYFNDQRKFGWMKLIPTLEVPNIDFMKKVGPEPLENNFQFSVFKSQMMRRKNSPVKAALLDQTVIAGIGNIYADESLWGAKLHPLTKVKDISETSLNTLYHEIRSILNLAIEKGGSTNKNYVNADGKRGSYMDFARVFRREGLECPRCGTIIIKFRAAGRGTHICPSCQIPPSSQT